MRVLVTGASGFIGKNLTVRLRERGDTVIPFTRAMKFDEVSDVVGIDAIVHLAGINRPESVDEFVTGNVDLTRELTEFVRRADRPLLIIYASTTQASLSNPYGKSKLVAEDVLVQLGNDTGSPVSIYRLPNVFGKWSRPNYNSAVATFCYNIANELPIRVDNPDATINLVYVDDVVDEFIRVLDDQPRGILYPEVTPVYSITVGDLARKIEDFKNCRKLLTIDAVGTGLPRALYSTYLSFLRPEQFDYSVPVHADPRGQFVEMLKTPDAGQFSFFTAHPGVTRGGHYHHTKTEKFLVLQGSARFRFRHILSGEAYEIQVTGAKPQVVETIPGWAHDISNVGDVELIAMLWASEIFDRARPDTISFALT
jgi:UDP-2-acetamido-2,6-beta-L-arabino-hexul-4-ose reductase